MFSSCIVLSSRVPCRRMTTRLRSSDDGTNEPRRRSFLLNDDRRRARRDRPPREPPTRFGTRAPWWRDAVIYEVYVRSFADGNGDGIGDLAGVRSRLPYLASLGIDAIWFTPWYARRWPTAATTSPTTARSTRRSARSSEAEALIAEGADARDPDDRRRRPQPRLDRHPWFQAALASPPGLAERARFWFRPGRGPNGDEMPTGWPSNFSGPSVDAHHEPRWHTGRVVPAPVRGRAARSQLGPSRRPRRARGDPAVLVRPRRRRGPDRLGRAAGQGPGAARDPVRARRPATIPTPTATSSTTSIAAGARSPTSTPGPGSSSARSGCPTPSASRTYLRPGELHTAFNFDFMTRPWDAREHARLDRRDAGGPRAGRRARDVGPLEPRRHPTGHPVRPGGHVVRLRPQASRHADGSRARTASGARRRAPGRRAAGLALHLPGRRARSRRGPGPARATELRGPDALPLRWRPIRAGTAAACRCPGRATSRRSASARRARRPSRGSASRRTGAPSRSTRSSPIRTRRSTCIAPRCGSAGSKRDLGDGPLRWLRRAGRRPGVRPRRSASSPSRTCRATPWPSQPGATPCSWPALTLDDGRLPPDATAWLRIDPDDSRPIARVPTREAE